METQRVQKNYTEDAKGKWIREHNVSSKGYSKQEQWEHIKWINDDIDKPTDYDSDVFTTSSYDSTEEIQTRWSVVADKNKVRWTDEAAMFSELEHETNAILDGKQQEKVTMGFLLACFF